MFKNSGTAILFCLGMYLLINIIVAFLVHDNVAFTHDVQKFSDNINILNLMALLWLIASIVILLKAIITQEKFDLRLKWASALLIAVLVVSIVMGFT